MNKKAIFVAATGQDVGKTTVCLGLVAGLKKRFSSIGFIKPVGQRSVRVNDDTHVDKDVALFKEYFQITGDYAYMSPVLLPKGFTRDYLDGKVEQEDLCRDVIRSYEIVSKAHEYTVVEGTGHSAVGSIVNMSNARVAADLGLDVVIVVPAGLGSALDELALNKNLFDSYGVSIRGVVLNRVLDSKRSMILEYFPKALERWGVPLLGCIPYNNLLGTPSIKDLLHLFHAELLAGQEHIYRHFENMRMVATSVETYAQLVTPNQLVITSASREDIILATVENHRHQDLQGGMLLTGESPPREEIVTAIRSVDMPVIYTPLTNYVAMDKLTSHTSKIRQGDVAKVAMAVQLVEEHVDFDLLLKG